MRMHRSNLLILLSAALIMVGIGYRHWPDIQMAYATEDAPLAWLQSSLIFGCAVTCAQRACLPRRCATDWVWPFLALALLGAALDERFMYHEAVQDWLRYDILGDRPWAARATGAVTLVYAIAGLTVLVALKKAIGGLAFRWIGAAVAIGVVAVGLDIAFNNLAWQTLEEMLETAAETLMLCGLFTEVRLTTTAFRCHASLTQSGAHIGVPVTLTGPV